MGERSQRRFEVEIAEPCSQSWAAMRAVSGGRHCDACRRDVVDVASLTAKQAELLAMRSAAGDSICARVTRDGAGELVLRRDTGGRLPAMRGVLMSAVLAAGVPALAQGVDGAERVKLPPCGPPAKPDETVTGCDRVEPPATVTGTLRHPDGTAVTSGLVRVSGHNEYKWYVVDELGTFEIHEEPGTYDFIVQTGPDQAEHVGVVELHAGYQAFGEMRTQAGQAALVDDNSYTTVGEMVMTLKKWGWKTRLRHPLLYVRSVIRRLG
jgi:hypothetical protein